MGKKLQRYLYFINLQFLFFFFCPNVENVQAQIAITDLSPHELVFTLGQTRLYDSSAEVSLHEMHLLTGEGTFDKSLWAQFGETDKITPYFFIENQNNGGVSIGKNVLGSEGSYFSISYVNNTNVDFDGLTIAFDFIHQSSNVQAEEPLFSLHSRVNNTEWKQVEGGIIHPSVLSSEEEWSSFSMQVHLDDIYLRNNDKVDFRWIENPVLADTIALPLALQRVEFSAVENNRELLENGSIIITEILPQAAFGDEKVEYIEIFNPTEQPVSLKGLTIQSEAGEVTVQTNSYIEPGAFFVFANKDAVRRNEVEADYTYTGTIIPSRRGVISLHSGEKELAKATYQSAEQGTSLELNHAKHSFDGYSSLEHFKPSVSDLGAGVRGSPGESGSTVKMFRKEIQQAGWYLFSLPGQLIPELNSHTSLRYSRTNQEQFVMQDLSVAEPFLVYKEGSEPATMFADNALENTPYTASLNRHSVIAGFPHTEPFGITHIKNGKNEIAAPIVMFWDQNVQRFTLVFNEEDRLTGWEPLILNQSAAGALHIDTSGRSVNGPKLNRYLQFRLFEENRNEKKLLDDTAILGFLKPSTGQPVRYDLPKLLPFRNKRDETLPRSLIYLSSSENDQRSTSFSHLPFEPEKAYHVRLGQFISGGSGNFILDWTHVNDIPEEWIITLEDTYTGNKIDMQEQTSYNFRSAGGGDLEITDENASALTFFKPDQNERFLITVEPYEDIFQEQEESTQPQDIELRQNYPNPFNPATTIEYYLPEEQSVRLGIYNVVGQQVAILVDDNMSSGEHSITWNASDMPSGIYIVQLELGNRMLTRKITLIK